MATFFGLVFIVAWILGMVQLCGYAYRGVLRAWSLSRRVSRSAASPSGEPAERPRE